MKRSNYVKVQDTEKTNRIISIAENSFRAILLIFALLDLILDDFIEVHQATVLYHSMLTFVMSYIPNLIRKKTRFKDIPELRISILIFLILTQFLGEIFDLFMVFAWWDVMIHFVSAVIITFIGYTLLNTFFEKKEKGNLVISVFALSFSMMVASFWEIFEYLMDISLSLNMQKNGLVDTMEDIIVCFVASFITCAFYVYKKRTNSITSSSLMFENKYNSELNFISDEDPD